MNFVKFVFYSDSFLMLLWWEAFFLLWWSWSHLWVSRNDCHDFLFSQCFIIVFYNFLLAFSLPVMNLLSPTGFQYSCVLHPGYFETVSTAYPGVMHMNTGEDKSLVDWIFVFVLGLHGKVLVGGVVREIGAGVAPVRRKQKIPPCQSSYSWQLQDGL